MYEVEFDKTNVTVGDTVTLSVNASAGTNEIEKITIQMVYYINSSDSYNMYHKFNIGNTGSDWSTTYTIGQYDPDTHYIIQMVIVYDTNGNQANFQVDESFVSPKLDVYGTTPDYIGPTLNSVSISPGNVTGGDIIDIELNVTDNLSGVKYVNAEFGFFNDTDGTAITILDAVDIDLINQGNGLWSTSFEVSKFWQTGTYLIPVIHTLDNQDNPMWYENNTSYSRPDSQTFISPTVNIYGTQIDLTKPQLVDFWFSTNYISPGGNFEAYVNATDNKSGVNYVFLQFNYLANGVSIYGGYGELQFNNETKLFEGTITIFDSVSTATELILDRVEISDAANNDIAFIEGNDFTSPKILLTDRSSPVSIVVHQTNDTYVDEVKSFNIEMESEFLWDINATLEFKVTFEQTEIHSEMVNLTVQQGTSDVNIQYIFHEIGEYIIEFTLSGQYGKLTGKSILEDVVEYQKNNDHNSTGNSSNFNTSEIPTLDLSGYTIYPVILSIFSVVLINFRKRR